ncbi:unnamed protein product [Ixodes persulcatus]
MTLKARIENGIVYSPYPSEAVPELSLYQAVKQRIEQHGNRTAVVWENEEITWADFFKMCQRYAAGFQGYGIKKGEKVMVHLDNSLENLITMYSVIFAGGVAVLSFPGFSNGEELRHPRASKRGPACQAGISLAPALDPAVSPTSTPATLLFPFCFGAQVRPIKRLGYFTVGTAEGFISVTEFKKLNEDMYEEFPVEDVKNEVILVIYTSGTTGRPKAVEHTHYSIVARLPPR